MANIIQKLLNVDILLALGLLIYMIGQPGNYIPASVSGVVAPYSGVGALLVVVAAIMALYTKFKK